MNIHCLHIALFLSMIMCIVPWRVTHCASNCEILSTSDTLNIPDSLHQVHHLIQLDHEHNLVEIHHLLRSLNANTMNELIHAVNYLRAATIHEHIKDYFVNLNMEKISQWYDEYTMYGKKIDPKIRDEINVRISTIQQEMTQRFATYFVESVIHKLKEMTTDLFVVEFKMLPDQTLFRSQLLQPRLSTSGLKEVVHRHVGTPIDRLLLCAAGRVLKDCSDCFFNKNILQQCSYKIQAIQKQSGSVVPVSRSSQRASIQNSCRAQLGQAIVPENSENILIENCTFEINDVSTLRLKSIVSARTGVPLERITLVAGGRILRDNFDASINKPILQSGNNRIFVVLT